MKITVMYVDAAMLPAFKLVAKNRKKTSTWCAEYKVPLCLGNCF